MSSIEVKYRDMVITIIETVRLKYAIAKVHLQKMEIMNS